METGYPIGSDGPFDDPAASPGLAHACPYSTDPELTEELWRNVAKMTSRTSGLKRGGRTKGPASRTDSDSGKIGPSASASTSVFDQADSHATPGSTLSNTLRTVSPRNTNYSRLILNPRGIYIKDTNVIVPSAFAHFRTDEPLATARTRYKGIASLSAANVWVTMDEETAQSIAAEYREMRGLGLCEDEFATFAKETFLLRERRSLLVSEDRRWRAERMLQLVCPPKESAHWRIPPVLEDSVGEVEWTWDIRPDCAYWLSLKGFNQRYRFQIQNCTFVRDWITCPYFTIEFKRDGESEDVAVKQVAAAGSMALYNRHHLHAEALGYQPDLSVDEETIRHYSLTFVFWVLRPTLDNAGRWNGCAMKRLVGADCTDAYGVRELVDWINEIHRWGLSKHGPSCERAIKAVLQVGGVRTSDIHESLN
jgi:hypothetical protein